MPFRWIDRAGNDSRSLGRNCPIRCRTVSRAASISAPLNCDGAVRQPVLHRGRTLKPASPWLALFQIPKSSSGKGQPSNRSVGDARRAFFRPYNDKTARQVANTARRKCYQGSDINVTRARRSLLSGRTIASGTHLGSSDQVVTGSHADALQSNRDCKKPVGLFGNW